MKYHAENAVSSFFYYMWNAWSKEECKVVFGGDYLHFWEKWNAQAENSIYGAAERFYTELSECSRTLLVERAVSQIYISVFASIQACVSTCLEPHSSHTRTLESSGSFLKALPS